MPVKTELSISEIIEKMVMRRPKKYAGRGSRRSRPPIALVMAGDTDEDEYVDVEDSSDDEEAIKVDESGKPLTEETKELVELFSNLRGGPDIIRYFNSLPGRERKRLLRIVQKELGLPVGSRKKGKKSKSAVIPTDIGSKPLFIRIVEMNSNLPPGLKAEMLRRYFNPGSSPDKNGNWIETVLRIPYGRYAPHITEEDLAGSQGVLDSVVYGHQEAKHKLLTYLAQLVRNQDSSGLILGLRSYPGVGKTSLIELGMSKILKRPFFSTSLGGAHDSSLLRGFSYTYEGAMCGSCAQWIIQAGILNPVIFLDELDKISTTAHGDEITNTLIQLTDPLQSRVFQDKFLGSTATIDLSRCIFVFAYNDRSLINPILRDRITEIELHGFSPEEKLVIGRDYLVPKIVKNIGFPEDQIPRITDAAITACIDRYTTECGLRHLKRILEEIFMELNLRAIMGRTETMEPVQQVVDVDDIESLIRSYKPISTERTTPGKVLGRVNGLYVDSGGSSGILPLEATWIPALKTTSHALRVTGHVGKVFGESSSVAWSVAWNILTPEKKEEWINRWHAEKRPRIHSPEGLAGRMSGHSTMSAEEQISRSAPVQPPVFDLTTRTPAESVSSVGVARGCLHIHCRDGATPKDGPSAGVALTMLMWSMLTDTPLPQEISYTGEVSVNFDVLPIGGLDQKLIGAHRAGCTTVIIPTANVKDLPRIIPGADDGSMKVLAFSDIREVLNFVLSQ